MREKLPSNVYLKTEMTHSSNYKQDKTAVHKTLLLWCFQFTGWSVRQMECNLHWFPGLLQKMSSMTHCRQITDFKQPIFGSLNTPCNLILAI